jgi:hypothetical protein
VSPKLIRKQKIHSKNEKNIQPTEKIPFEISNEKKRVAIKAVKETKLSNKKLDELI